MYATILNIGIALIVLWSTCGQSVNASAIPKEDDLDKQDDKTIFGDENEWSDVVIRIGTQGKPKVRQLHELGKENTSPKNEFENTTLPHMLCWEVECPECPDLESPIRCFMRGLLQVAVRSSVFILLIVLLFICAYTLNKRQSAKRHGRAKNKGRKILQTVNLDKDYLIEQPFTKESDIENLIENK